MCFGSHFLHLITVQLSRFNGCRGFKNAQTENKQLNKNTIKLRKSKPFYCFSFSFFVGHPTFGYSTPLTCYWLSKTKKKKKRKSKNAGKLIECNAHARNAPPSSVSGYIFLHPSHVRDVRRLTLYR